MFEPPIWRPDRHIEWCSRHSVNARFRESHKLGMLS
jgi:hypothetical protein